MEKTTKEYAQYLRIGEMGTLRIEEEGGCYRELLCIIVQMQQGAAELVLVSDELPSQLLGAESDAELSIINGHLQCDVPVVIGKNSFEQTLFVRFNGLLTVKIKRNFIRCDVLMPFIYTEHGRNIDKAIREVSSAANSLAYRTFEPVPHGESYKVLNWQDQEELLPMRINLGGGGVRFATVEPFQRGTALGLQMFLDGPKPRVIHAVLQVTRSKPFEQTMEDRAFYTWAKIRLKSKTLSITAGQYEFIDEGDRQAVIDYIKEKQTSQHAPVETERINEP